MPAEEGASSNVRGSVATFSLKVSSVGAPTRQSEQPKLTSKKTNEKLISSSAVS